MAKVKTQLFFSSKKAPENLRREKRGSSYKQTDELCQVGERLTRYSKLAHRQKLCLMAKWYLGYFAAVISHYALSFPHIQARKIFSLS